MKESIDNNEQFYNLSEYNIINSNNNLILPFESHPPKENKIFEDNSRNDTYKIILGKHNKINDILYESNEISTSKYTFLNAIPKILMEQLSRICNIYLLIIALFQSIKSISYTNGYPLVLIPLTSLILLNGLKDFIEDRKRKISDKKENNNEILIYNQSTKSFIRDAWKNIKLGDIIKVKNENQFPCDIIFLQSSPEAKGQCKVDTKNINGETNLNIKKINPNFNIQNISDLNHLCITKKPNEHIYEFEAIFHGISNQNNILDINENNKYYFNYDNFILRGSSLKQTEYIIGVAIYIGHNTKSMKNNPLAKQKISRLEKSMNYQILFIFIFQIILSIVASIINLIIFYSNNNFIEKFVKIAENNDSFMLRFIKMIGTWTLLLTNFVPIPLLSSLEFIKFFQAMFISRDVDMINKHTFEKVKLQSSTLNDELGQINYIFTDKTGTLTKNNMHFKAFTVGEKSFGDINN
jgi:phospholipid-transporting ATPase